jgi:hypothetical protein
VGKITRMDLTFQLFIRESNENDGTVSIFWEACYENDVFVSIYWEDK